MAEADGETTWEEYEREGSMHRAGYVRLRVRSCRPQVNSNGDEVPDDVMFGFDILPLPDQATDDIKLAYNFSSRTSSPKT